MVLNINWTLFFKLAFLYCLKFFSFPLYLTNPEMLLLHLFNFLPSSLKKFIFGVYYNLHTTPHIGKSKKCLMRWVLYPHTDYNWVIKQGLISNVTGIIISREIVKTKYQELSRPGLMGWELQEGLLRKYLGLKSQRETRVVPFNQERLYSINHWLNTKSLFFVFIYLFALKI